MPSTRKNSKKKTLIQRDGSDCWLCGKPFGKGQFRSSIDHVVPISKGGSNKNENLKLAHIKCNNKRGDKEMSDKPKLGPTGNFPRGKFSDDDKGELQIAVGVKDKTVIIQFGAPISWIGMDKDMALQLAAAIIEKTTLI